MPNHPRRRFDRWPGGDDNFETFDQEMRSMQKRVGWLVAAGVVVGLVITGVIVWAIIALVLHFT